VGKGLCSAEGLQYHEILELDNGWELGAGQVLDGEQVIGG